MFLMSSDNLAQAITVGTPQTPVISLANFWIRKIKVFTNILHCGNGSNTLSFNVRLGCGTGRVIRAIVINLFLSDSHTVGFACR